MRVLLFLLMFAVWPQSSQAQAHQLGEAAMKVLNLVSNVAGKVAAHGFINKVVSATTNFRNVLSASGKKVLLTFTGDGCIDGGGNFTMIWNPQKQDLSDVFAKVGLTSVADFQFTAHIKIGDQIVQIALEGEDDIEQLQDETSEKYLPVIVTLRQASITERAKAKAALVGEWLEDKISSAKQAIVGTVPKESAVQKAENDLVSNSGISGMEQRMAALEYKGYDLDKWKDAVPTISEELELTETKKKQLLLAANTDEAKSSSLRHRREDADNETGKTSGKLVTTFTNYRTIRDKDNNKMHFVYGHYELACNSENEKNPRLAAQIQRYVEIMASRSWAKQLGMPTDSTPESIEARSNDANQDTAGTDSTPESVEVRSNNAKLNQNTTGTERHDEKIPDTETKDTSVQVGDCDDGTCSAEDDDDDV